MIEKQLTIINKLGLHARASAKFVSTANRFQSQLTVKKGNQSVNGKSIMGVMMLAAPLGSDIVLIFDGPDEEHMAEAMTSLISNKFGEPE
ncbi:HPr family phosphocarrier protein [Legionella sp. W05-934-2]|jgi:phosphocarrier protein|uniref:HPr family phosphocarrier protein n=1 Tax=Legionella sp. W05-934-2 TaxID=1198649 RepID=UPI00346273EB